MKKSHKPRPQEFFTEAMHKEIFVFPSDYPMRSHMARNERVPLKENVKRTIRKQRMGSM